MTVEVFMTLLTFSSVITSLSVEALKKVGNYKSYNLVALIVSIIVGAIVCLIAYLYLRIEWSLLNLLYMIGFIGMNWLCATLGYDKVVQAISQKLR